MSVTLEELVKQVKSGNYSLLKKDPVFQKAVKEVANIISKGYYTNSDVIALQDIEKYGEDSDKLYDYVNTIPEEVIESIVGNKEESYIYMYIGNCIVATGVLQAFKSQDAQATLGAKIVDYGMLWDNDEPADEVNYIIDSLKDWEVK